MHKGDILILYDYNYWATARVLNAAAKLTPEQFTAPAGLSHGSVCGTLAHVVNHGAQFRGEAGTALTACGQSPGDLDLLLYFREKMA